ncbi:MAG: hypothetical protein QOH50_5046 [Kribbellaceae bacterium]|nr:hypothetical protein [Kribbellaceae bacterium]
MSLFLNVFTNDGDDFLVYRVNWLRARSQWNRWSEELPRTEKEMIWTTLYFMHQRDVWYRTLSDQNGDKGLIAYCEKKIYHWEEMARVADFQFRSANEDYPGVWCPIVPKHM